MRIRRSLMASLGQRYLSLAMTLAVTMLSARLLGPVDFGEFAIAHSVIIALARIAEAGMGAYLVQESRLRLPAVRTAFGITLVTSLACVVAVLLGRDVIADAFDSARIAELLLILVIILALEPFNAVRTGLFLRRLRFGQLVLCGFFGTLALAATTLGLLWLGFGVYALAWGAAAEAVVLTVALNIAGSRARWHPPSLANWRRALATGAPVTGARFARELGSVAPQLIVGRALGLNATGALSRANAVAALLYRGFLQGLLPVFTPAFADQVRRKRAMGESWLHALVLLSAVVWPAVLFLIVLAPSVVNILFGPDWGFITPYVILLCLGTLALPTISLTTELLVAVGDSQAQFNATMASQTIRIGLVLSLAVLTQDLLAVVGGIAAAQFAEAGLLSAAAIRRTGIAPRRLLSNLAPTAMVALVAVTPAVAVGVAGLAPLPSLIVAAVGAAVAWLAGLRFVNHPLWLEIAAVLTRARAGLANRRSQIT